MGSQKFSTLRRPQGLACRAELRPSQDFQDFLEGAEAAGQGDEGILLLGHQRLAFVHGVDDVQVLQVEVYDFAGDERLRGMTPVTLPPPARHGVRENAHQTDAVHRQKRGRAPRRPSAGARELWAARS